MSNRTNALYLCGALAACTSSSPANPPLGSGQFSHNGTAQTVTFVWAETAYAFFDAQNDSYGGYSIVFSSDGVTGASGPVRCSDRKPLGWAHQLFVMTSQVFSPHSPGQAKLTTGDIGVIADSAAPNTAPPSSAIAYFDSHDPGINSGTVTIEAFDTSDITGSFTAGGSGGTTITGSFTAPICAALP